MSDALPLTLPPLPPLPVGFSGGSLGKRALRNYARSYAEQAVAAALKDAEYVHAYIEELLGTVPDPRVKAFLDRLGVPPL